MLLVSVLRAGSIEVVVDSVPYTPLRPCSVVVRISERPLYDNVALTYWMGGEPAQTYDCDTAATTDSTVLFVIPAPFATPRGLCVQVSAVDNQTDTLTAPIDIPLLVPQRRAPDTCAYDQWRLVSFPLVPRSATVAGLLYDDLGGPDPTLWRAFSWDTDSSVYVELSAGDTLGPGDACWLRSRVARALLDIDTATTVPVCSAFHVLLRPGWNAISIPYLFAVNWQDILDNTPAHLNQIDGPYRWDGSAWENPIDNPALLPWEAYYVNNELPNPLDLNIPPLESDSAPPVLYRARSATEWTMRISVEQGASRESNDIIGVTSSGPVRHREPPSGPAGRTLTGTLMRGDSDDTACMTDIRAPAQDPSWRYAVRSSRGGVPVKVLVAPHRGPSFPAGGMVLIDSTARRVADLSHTPEYTYVPRPGETQRELHIVAADSARLAGAFAPAHRPTAAAVRVVPSTAAATVHYEVPDHRLAAAVVVDIYSLDGALVRRLVSGIHAPGHYHAAWDGCDGAGRRVPAAAYVCRLRIHTDGVHSKLFALTRQP
ncbi:MAG: hypothetical protein GF331_17970 [Chitinivibrionales bacterium]|nr:hypothetical protein [Chitinivibrionales bacterium]